MLKSIFVVSIYLSILSMIGCPPTDCQKFKNGKFRIPQDSISGEWIIERNGNTQVERSKDGSQIFEFQVEWLDDCTYSLVPKGEKYSFKKGELKDGILIGKIIEVKQNSYILKSKFYFDDLVAYKNTVEIFKY